MSSPRRIQISDATAFDAADEFASAEQVREYFSVDAQRSMFGDDAITDQDVLDSMADDVIEHRWHMAPDEATAKVAATLRELN